MQTAQHVVQYLVMTLDELCKEWYQTFSQWGCWTCDAVLLGDCSAFRKWEAKRPVTLHHIFGDCKIQLHVKFVFIAIGLW